MFVKIKLLFAFLSSIFLLNGCGLGNTDHPAQHPANAPSVNVDLDEKNHLVLFWSSGRNATSYQIRWSTRADMSGAAVIDGVQPPYVFDKGSPGQTIYVTLNTTWDGKAGPSSGTVSFIRPPNPPQIKSVAIENNQVTIEWTKSDGAEKYRVYRSEEIDINRTNAILVGDGISANDNEVFRYLDTSAVAGKTYYYVVVSLIADSPSTFGTAIKFDTPNTLATIIRGEPPSNVSAKSDNGFVTLSWTSPNAGVTFNVYRGTNSDLAPGGVALVAGLQATTYTDKEVLIGATYYYVITAVTDNVESRASITQSVTPTVPVGVATYTIGGTVNGLIGKGLKLVNNGVDIIEVNNNGVFTFKAKGIFGSRFNAVVYTQPTQPSQNCRVVGGKGELLATNETSISVDCVTNQYAIRVNVKGLEGGGLVLQNNGGDDLIIPAKTNGTFTFSKTLVDRSPYVVSVKTQPSQKWQTCTLPLSQGLLDGADVMLDLQCSTDLFNVNGTIGGLTGMLKVSVNGGPSSLFESNGQQNFISNVERGASYVITISENPYRQTCFVDNGDGVVDVSADVTNVNIVCYDHFELEVTPSSKSVNLTWTHNTASSYNVYVSTDKNCDFSNYTSCPNSAVYLNRSSPIRISSLKNEQPYYFLVEGVLAANRKLVSLITGGRPNTIGFDGNVRAVAQSVQDGSTFVGGSFTHVGAISGSSVMLDTTRSLPTVVPEFPTITNGVVRASAPDNNGGWYIAGTFTSVGGVVRDNFAHILSDGNVDPNWNPINIFPPSTMEIVSLNLGVSNKGEVYVAATILEFDNPGVREIAILTRLLSDGKIDPSWNVLITWPDTPYISTIALSGEFVYVGGGFSSIGGTPRNNVARLRENGDVDTSWNPNANDLVSSLVVHENYIYIAGKFTSVAGESRNRIARLLADGSVDKTWNPNANAPVNELLIADNKVYVAGEFTSIGGQLRYKIARLLSNGQADFTWVSNINSGYISRFAVTKNITYVAGNYTVGGSITWRFGRLLGNGNFDTSWNVNIDDYRYIQSLDLSGDKLLVNGDFLLFGASKRNNIAHLYSDSGLDFTWNPNADKRITALVSSGSNLYVAGEFTSIGGQPRNYIARLFSNGNVDPAWNPSPNAIVETLALSSSTLYVGGSFSAINGQSNLRIARLSTSDGSVDSIWAPGANGTVRSISVSGSSIYVGGDFTSIGGQPRNYIAKLLVTDGTADASWNPNANFTVDNVVVAGANIFASGAFTTIGGQSRNHLVKLLQDGNADLLWNPNPNGNVYSIASNSNILYVGGSFSSIGGQARSNLALLNGDGTAASTWIANTNNTVYSLTLSTSLYVGGAFTIIGGQSRVHFAVLNSDGTLR